VEVSDLDHAPAEVRGSLADLFLQVLETGQAQSATGAMFSCASIIFAFTINLPNGMDEAVHKTFGFGTVPPEAEVQKRVVREIKNLFSTAFLSRIGTPIMFEPLDGNAIEMIVERAVESAVGSVLERLMMGSCRVVARKPLGRMIASSIDSTKESFGARLLIEHSRSLVAESLPQLRECCARESGDTLFVDYDGSGELIFSRK
jgi:ATP-dependent Clp protease ATP-binding subunit ClpA